MFKFLTHLLAASTLLMQPQQHVSTELLAAATVHPLAFLWALADASVPAGLEITEKDLSGPLGRIPADTSDEAWTTLPQVVAAFNTHHTEYYATITDGVLVIKPAASSAAYLMNPSPVMALRGKGLMTVTKALFAPLDPKLALNGPTGGSYLGPIGVEVDRGEALTLNIDLLDASVIDGLNRIVKQTPGHCWLVITTGGDVPKIARFGFAHRFHTTSEQPISLASQVQ